MTAQVFPGAVACVGWVDAGIPVFVDAFAGKFKPEDDATLVQADTLYDLASVTKPFTAMAALRLAVSGRLSLDARADSVVADARGGPGGSATLEQLLTHRGGLVPWGGLYLDVPHDPGTPAAKRWILSEATRRGQ